jgi:hypothetical protein
MIMLRKRSVGLIAAALAMTAALAAGLAAGPADAAVANGAVHSAHVMSLAAASEEGGCRVWSDKTSFGIECTGFPGWNYHAQAFCQDGNYAVGLAQNGTSGAWSYAYCSTYGSTINTANGIFNEGSIIAGPAGATALAGVNGSCDIWTDGVTFGIECTGFSGWSYYAAAVCVGGVEAAGTKEEGTSGAWSYAYCSKYNTNISYGDPYFLPFT